ncbi:endopeptidase La [bacterium]|nr:endopeptidase La [bacterium]
MSEKKIPKIPEKVEIPESLPILPLRGTIIFPFMIMPLLVGRGKSIKLINQHGHEGKIIGLVAQKDPTQDDPKFNELYSVGTAGIIIKKLSMADRSVRLIIQGISRIQIIKFARDIPYITARVSKIEEKEFTNQRIDNLMNEVLVKFKELVKISRSLTEENYLMAVNMTNPGKLADLVAFNLMNIHTNENQDILETFDVALRLEKVNNLIDKELQFVKLSSKIHSQAFSEIEKNQREYFLRQQLKAIQEELGEVDEKTAEINELRELIEKAKMPEEARKEAEKELKRLSNMPPAAAEYTVSRTYLDWLVNLPWSKSSKDKHDLKRAQSILDKDHYDLTKVKERIIEFLAVRKLKESLKGPILCFVGPPGVGKTSLGRSIAKALNRKFCRISLGGMRDEAEIRGHRRTYVGSLPGRILRELRRAGTNNPVFIFDEVDKIGMDFRGDPAAALLEVLDPEQNFSFSDHYLDVPFDLSKVMFITTANILDPVPPALKDRMEVLILPGYTEEEKLMIAKKFLIPKQIKENGLDKKLIKFHVSAIKEIIRNYTREAGLRNLEREIANICRKVAKNVAEGNKEPTTVIKDNVSKFLGPSKFIFDVKERNDEIGVATGLAWTQSGGDIIFVESTKMKGRKELRLTGHLGDVMKESAIIALNYIRSKSNELCIDKDFYSKNEIHVHVPAGAIPKDGPSAGITMATSIASLLRGIPVRHDIAMTGEITLRGKVLPIGGVKEKVLAAARADIWEVILPAKNKKDLEDIPKEIREKMKFHFVDKIDKVLDISLRK